MNFFDSFIEGSQGSTVKERGEFYVAVLEYLYYGREPDFRMCKWASQAFTLIHPVLENQLAKQKAGRSGGKARAKSQAEGQAEGQAKAKQKAKQNSSEQEQEQEDSLLKVVSGEEEFLPECSSKSTLLVGRAFVPPTVEEVRDYCDANGLKRCDPSLFIAYYASQGWLKPNKLPVTDWHPLAQQWHIKERNGIASKCVRERGVSFDEFSDDKWVQG